MPSIGQAYAKFTIGRRSISAGGLGVYHDRIALCIQAVRIAVTAGYGIDTGKGHFYASRFRGRKGVCMISAGWNLSSRIGDSHHIAVVRALKRQYYRFGAFENFRLI